MKYSKIVLVIMLIMLYLTGCGISDGKEPKAKNSTENVHTDEKIKKDKEDGKDNKDGKDKKDNKDRKVNKEEGFNKNIGANKKEIIADTKKLMEGFHDIYRNAKKEKKLDSLELKQQIVDYFGKAGYAAIDTENQINMVHSGQAEAFCEKAKKKLEAQTVILAIMEQGRVIRYDMKTKDGKIDVKQSSYSWKEGKPQATYYNEFQAYTWKYTENGYFFIEEHHMPGYDGPPGETGFRIKPLDRTCRELNQKYVMPMGYVRNNLLITDWDENNYKSLDFYDLYEKMYQMKYGSYVPYSTEYGGDEYQIPKAEFEGPIQTYLNIDSGELESDAVYNKETQTYRYRPRGINDSEFPYEPYPEVVAYKVQNDGTIKLTVNAVWVREEMDKALTSELVVRPLGNGGFQYVSNQVIPSPGSTKPTWYSKRMTDEEWNQYYTQKGIP